MPYRDAMKMLTAERLPWLAILLSGGLLCGAWFFQYVLDYAPCQMCYWQRHAHKAVLAAAVIALIMNHRGIGRPGFWATLTGLVLLVSFGLAFWHVGVEYKWWEGPKTCMTGPPKLGDYDGKSLLEALDKPIRLPGCSEAPWHFAGLSMAGWNAVVSFVGAAVSFASAGRAANA